MRQPQPPENAFVIAFTPEEEEALCQRAQAARMTPEEWIWRQLLMALAMPVLRDEVKGVGQA